MAFLIIILDDGYSIRSYAGLLNSYLREFGFDLCHRWQAAHKIGGQSIGDAERRHAYRGRGVSQGVFDRHAVPRLAQNEADGGRIGGMAQ